MEKGESALLTLIPVPVYLVAGWTFVTMGNVFRPSDELKRQIQGADQDAHVVKMTILRHDQPIGQDEGLVTFSGDQLVYEGQLTSFRISVGAVEAPLDQFANGPLMRSKDEHWRFGNLVGNSAWGFLLRDYPEIRVHFFPLKVAGHPSIYQPMFLWLRREPLENSQSILPPIEPLPGYKSPIGFLGKKTQANKAT